MATVLNLDTLVPTDDVRINGVNYWLRPGNALTLREYRIYERAMTRLFVLLAQDDLTEAEDTEASGLLQQICGVVLDAPADVREGLTDAQRLEVFIAFTPLRSKLNLPTTGATAAGRSIGASGSRASSSTTAARRKAGSTKSRRG